MIHVLHKKEGCIQIIQIVFDKNDLIHYRNAKRMPDDVKDAVKLVIMDCGSLTEDEAELYIRKLEQCRRYQAETWS